MYASVSVCARVRACVRACVVEGLQTKHADRTRWLTPTEKRRRKKRTATKLEIFG